MEWERGRWREGGKPLVQSPTMSVADETPSLHLETEISRNYPMNKSLLI